MSKHYEKAVNIALRAQKDIQKALEPVPAVAHQMVMELDRLINRLNFLGGLKVQASRLHKEFQPVTEFMGEAISNEAQIDAGYINPDEADRALYLQKVKSLYEQFNTMDPAALLNTYTSKEDKMVILGVAKRAGLDVTGGEELNVAFIETVGKAIVAKDTYKKADAELEAQLKQLSQPTPALPDADND